MLDTTGQLKNFSPEETIRVALLVEYCGKDFHGSQFQVGFPTVQQAFEDALRGLNLQTSAVSFAGRTDAGVNALGQVAHFDVPVGALNNIDNLAAGLNAHLPESVSVRDVHVNTGMNFNSRREAKAKWYRYVIHNNENRSVWANRQASTHFRPLLDADCMHAAAQLLIGRQDCKSFKDSDTPVTDDICHVRHASVTRHHDSVIFDIVADRFLYKMVRNLAGQLMAIGNTEKPLPVETLQTVMAQRDRTKAAATARPEGLTLMAITYPPPFNFFDADRPVRHLQQMIQNPQLESLHNEHVNQNLFRKAS